MDVFINKVQAVQLFQSSNAAEKSFIFYPVIYILLLVGLLLRICVLQSYLWHYRSHFLFSVGLVFCARGAVLKKFQMLFEQNIASNVTRNQESKHITNLNILKEPPSMPMGPQACPSTQNNYLEYKSWRNFIKVLLLIF